ncbi:hypothetical protein ON010_g11803 [Phytophthora cinnamomi]|nr:hypothetical protein ON010_g11803 [Phytophthora cinnamomi]
MRTTPRGSSDDHTLNGSQSRTNGAGVRRKRQGERLVHARIRAVYNDVGRCSFPVKQISKPYNAASTLNSKSKGFQDAEVHDEYYRLLDAESELKAVCLQEQQKRVKAVAHARRLEEIISMKDKKIESLLNAKTVGADRTLGTSKSVVQREVAERDRQFHTLVQRLKQKIAQQSQLLSSYEEAMQSLRSSIKSTNLTELEEERSQLYQELRHHQELLGRQRLEWESHQQKLVALAEAEAINKFQIAKLQQDNKVIAHEKRKLEQEVGFLKSRVELLQSKSEFGAAQAREKLKSPKSGTIPPRPDSFASPSVTAFPTALATVSELKTPSRAKLPPPKSPRPSSAASTRSTSTSTRQVLQRMQKSFDNSHQEIKVGVIAAGSTISRESHTSSVKDQGRQENSRFGVEAELAGTHNETGTPIEQAGQEGAKISPQDITDVCAGECAEMQEQSKQEASGPACQASNPEPDPGGGEQPLSIVANQTEPTADQADDEEMESRQQQALAAVQSVLRFDVDDEFDSEMSADLLDDAQHPMLRSDTESTITRAEAALDKVSPNAETGVVGLSEAPLPLQSSSGPREDPLDSGSQFSQSLDDMYPSDFLDTDAQASTGNENEDE